MTKYFFSFGHNGWTAKFVDIFRYLQEIDSEAELSGIVFGTYNQFIEAKKGAVNIYDSTFIF